MNELKALQYFMANGLTAAGACGLVGNFLAESSGKANIAQRGMTTLSDEQYTLSADNGTINFVYDSVGYGLAQWTYHTRKKNLLNYAKSKGLSIGNEQMQLEFALYELQQAEYKELYKLLCSTNGVYEAAAAVCRIYERPAVNNIDYRAGLANELYMRFGAILEGETNNSFSSGFTVVSPTNEKTTKTVELSREQKIYYCLLLEKIGYSMVWDVGLKACVTDFQQKTGKIDNIYNEIMEVAQQ